jgi:hypothetical protein
MADRLLVAYKTPFQRIIETLLALAGTYGLAELCRWLVPALPPSYAIVAGLIVGIAALQWAGSRWAESHGAAMMTRDERNRRYISELGPIGMNAPAWRYASVKSPAMHRRHGTRRPARRH